MPNVQGASAKRGVAAACQLAARQRRLRTTWQPRRPPAACRGSVGVALSEAPSAEAFFAESVLMLSFAASALPLLRQPVEARRALLAFPADEEATPAEGGEWAVASLLSLVPFLGWCAWLGLALVGDGEEEGEAEVAAFRRKALALAFVYLLPLQLDGLHLGGPATLAWLLCIAHVQIERASCALQPPPPSVAKAREKVPARRSRRRSPEAAAGEAGRGLGRAAAEAAWTLARAVPAFLAGVATGATRGQKQRPPGKTGGRRRKPPLPPARDASAMEELLEFDRRLAEAKKEPEQRD